MRSRSALVDGTVALVGGVGRGLDLFPLPFPFPFREVSPSALPGVLGFSSVCVCMLCLVCEVVGIHIVSCSVISLRGRRMLQNAHGVRLSLHRAVCLSRSSLGMDFLQVWQTLNEVLQSWEVVLSLSSRFKGRSKHNGVFLHGSQTLSERVLRLEFFIINVICLHLGQRISLESCLSLMDLCLPPSSGSLSLQEPQMIWPQFVSHTSCVVNRQQMHISASEIFVSRCAKNCNASKIEAVWTCE